MKKIRLLEIGFLIVALAGCGTAQRQQEAAEFAKYPAPENGSKVLVVPIGSAQANNVGSMGGLAFGLIGALVEGAITSSTAEDKNKTANTAMAQERIEDYLANQVLANVAGCGITGQANKEVLAKDDKEWLNKTTSVLPNLTKVKANYVVETGATELMIASSIARSKLCISGAAKVFRVSDGVLVNKVKGSNRSGLLCNQALSHYSDSDPEKYEELKAKTKEALNEVAIQLASGVCRKAREQ